MFDKCDHCSLVCKYIVMRRRFSQFFLCVFSLRERKTMMRAINDVKERQLQFILLGPRALVWKGLTYCRVCILLTFNWLKPSCLVLLVPAGPRFPVKSTLQLWWSIQERRGYQWLLINLALCSLTKKQRNKVEFQCRRLSQSQRA